MQNWKIADLTLAELVGAGARVRKEECGRTARVAVMGDCATQNYAGALGAALKLAGVWPEIYEGGFAQTFQEVLDPESGLHRHKPQFVLLVNAVQALQDRWVSSEPKEGFAAAVAGEIELAWDRLLRIPGVTVVQHNYCLPLDRPFGNHTLACPGSFADAVRTINGSLLAAAGRRKGVVLFDTEYQASYFGKKDWLSERFWCQARQPCSPRFLPPLVKGLTDVLLARLGGVTKCVILDLDNTLWSGILADDGVEGLQLGDSGVGLAFQRFQRFLAQLKDRGILLAVCSKNREETARDAFRSHPEMALREQDLVAFIANYDNKAANIRKIREALDIGFDSMVFLDDSPFERDLVRTALPQVQVPELPEDPAEFVAALARWNLFETVDFTAEDSGRLRMYQENVKRIELRDQFQDLDVYLGNLQMVGEVAPFDAMSLPRVSQLVQRSNQFNLTTQRHGEARLLEFARSPEHATFSVRLLDRLGDNGIVVCVVCERRGTDLVVDTWVMSCRVLGRKVEDFTLRRIFDIARERGCTRVVGQYRKTAKNAMVADLYPRLGFREIETEGETRRFALDLSAYRPKDVPIRLSEPSAKGETPRT